jgi:hypothetical protein
MLSAGIVPCSVMRPLSHTSHAKHRDGSGVYNVPAVVLQRTLQRRGGDDRRHVVGGGRAAAASRTWYAQGPDRWHSAIGVVQGVSRRALWSLGASFAAHLLARANREAILPRRGIAPLCWLCPAPE